MYLLYWESSHYITLSLPTHLPTFFSHVYFNLRMELCLMHFCVLCHLSQCHLYNRYLKHDGWIDFLFKNSRTMKSRETQWSQGSGGRVSTELSDDHQTVGRGKGRDGIEKQCGAICARLQPGTSPMSPLNPQNRHYGLHFTNWELRPGSKTNWSSSIQSITRAVRTWPGLPLFKSDLSVPWAQGEEPLKEKQGQSYSREQTSAVSCSRRWSHFPFPWPITHLICSSATGLFHYEQHYSLSTNSKSMTKLL